jgi:hypothetical protein
VLDSGDEYTVGEKLGRVVRKYQKSAPKLAQWIAENVPESFAVFRLPPTHRVRLRTTNMLERVNKELKRRTRVATLFPNEASQLRLATAVLMELSEEWETGKRYLTFETKQTCPISLRHFYRRNGMVSVISPQSACSTLVDCQYNFHASSRSDPPCLFHPSYCVNDFTAVHKRYAVVPYTLVTN